MTDRTAIEDFGASDTTWLVEQQALQTTSTEVRKCAARVTAALKAVRNHESVNACPG